MKPTHQTDRYTLYHGDCLDVLPTLEAGSVDAVIADIPYFGVVSAEWDNQWASMSDFQEWVDQWAQEVKRVLKDNGSMFVFGDDKHIAYVQVVLDKYFLLLNAPVWYKVNALPQKNADNLRSFAPMTERLLFYTAQYDPTGWQSVKLDVNNFLPLRDYFKQYQEAIGLNIKQINEHLGHRKAEHGFYWNSTQWDLPTAETYEQLGSTFYTNGFVRREYEDLRREYEDLRRTWNGDGDTYDVIHGPIVSQKDNTPHPTTKPLWLMEKLVKLCTNEGDVILDFCMGSGRTGVAAVKHKRSFIGCDIGREWVDYAAVDIANAAGDFCPAPKDNERQMALFW